MHSSGFCKINAPTRPPDDIGRAGFVWSGLLVEEGGGRLAVLCQGSVRTAKVSLGGAIPKGNVEDKDRTRPQTGRKRIIGCNAIGRRTILEILSQIASIYLICHSMAHCYALAKEKSACRIVRQALCVALDVAAKGA